MLLKKLIESLASLMLLTVEMLLELVDSDDPLEAGLEMFVSLVKDCNDYFCQREHNRFVKNSVFLVNPSVGFDEDAPLDDSNVTRFLLIR